VTSCRRSGPKRRPATVALRNSALFLAWPGEAMNDSAPDGTFDEPDPSVWVPEYDSPSQEGASERTVPISSIERFVAQYRALRDATMPNSVALHVRRRSEMDRWTTSRSGPPDSPTFPS
jgi:hypothetical protein